MRRRLLPAVALFCVAALPLTARPAEAPDPAQAKRPGLVLRAQPIDELLANVTYLAALAGQEEQAKQLEGLIKALKTEKGLGGIDTKRPLALYGSVGPNGIDSTAVVLVPVADEQDVLNLMAGFGVQPEKGKDGLFTLNLPNVPVPVYFRFANKYAYITAQDAAAIAPDKLIAPEKVSPPGQSGVLSVSFLLAEIPDGLKQLALQQMQDQLDQAKKERDPNETDAQHKFKGQFIDAVGVQIASLLRDGDDVTLSLNIDRQKDDISLDLNLTGKSRSKLAASIADLAQAKSVVAGLISRDSTFNTMVYAVLPEDLRKGLAPVLDEAIREALEKEKDKTKRELGAKLAKVIEPTLKAAELDAAIDLRGPSDKNLYTMVAGLKLQDGAEIERTLRDLVKDLPAEEKAKVKLDADQAGAVKIHRFDVQKDVDEEFRKSFGDNPAYVAIRADAAFVGVGEKGLNALKEALAAPPRAAVPMRMEFSWARLAAAMEAGTKGAVKAAEEAFGKDKTNDKLFLSVEGGDGLRVRVSMKAPVIKFLSKLPGVGLGGGNDR